MQLVFTIKRPIPGTTVGRRITVSGSAGSRRTAPHDSWPQFDIDGVEVDFGDGSPVPADVTTGTWTCTGSAPPTTRGGAALTITAILGYTRTNLGPGGDPGDPVALTARESVTVKLADDVPEGVTIDAFTSPVTPQVLPYHVTLTGTANDTVNGIKSVQLRVDDGAFGDVSVEERFGVWFWAKELDLDAGAYTVTVRAVDGAGNARDATRYLRVQEPFVPGDVEQVFEPIRYLFEMCRFARRYVKVAGAPNTVTPAMLTARFHQPFDELTGAERVTETTAPVAQARIAVEVLRSRLGKPVPKALDQRFRAVAFNTFLRGLGTSADELRLARTAQPETRTALAARLGIRLTKGRPDRLDELNHQPDTITHKELERVTGYRSTAGDPLRPGSDEARVLLWRRDALRARWQDEDQDQRDAADGARPIIDPDLVPESHLRNRQPGDPAYALWTARRDWITEKYDSISRAVQAGDATPARFDHVVTAYVGTIDMPGLAARDANGSDVQPDLVPLELSLDAFRFLARLRALLATGVRLETEWDDVVAILLQVQKRRRYQTWRLEERRASLVLEPASFQLEPAGTAQLPRWRAPRREYVAWRNTLSARQTAADALETGYSAIVAAMESTALPQLRDALINAMAKPDESPDAAAERLTRELMIDLRSDAGQRTTRVHQGLETLRSALFSARAGRLGRDASGARWTIDVNPTGNLDFDREWDWMGSYPAWLSAMRVFAYPENQLYPTLYVDDPGVEAPTPAYIDLIASLRQSVRLTPDDARELVRTVYLDKVRAGAGLDDAFVLTDRLGDDDLADHQSTSRDLFNAHKPHQREVFWLVPMAMAAKLQESGQFQAALDWYRIVYAYHLPRSRRRIYYGLEAEKDIASTYVQVPEWLIEELNPHLIATTRNNCYTKATIMAIAACFNAFADTEFARGTADANARARTLYESAIDLLDPDEVQPGTGPEASFPFPPNPVWESIRVQAQTGQQKIHHGLNIAGVAIPGTAYETALPSQYRYGVLIERARNLVAIAQQTEAAYLSTLEQRDAKAYDELRARNDLEVAGAAVSIQTTKLAEAVTGVRLADLQRQRAQLQEDHYETLISDGYSGWEQAGLAALGAAAAFHTASIAAFGGGAIVNSAKMVLTFGLLGDPVNDFGQMLSAAASAAATGAQIAQTIASHERQVQDWQLQKSLAAKDGEIADKQFQAAEFQLQQAGQERQLAVLQQDHAQTVATFLATRFTNAELFEWMSGVLGRVYAFFLQQATALAQLAEAQLAFERQELPAGFIGSDYWRDASSGAGSPDRRGLTGSARLLQDVTRLDQYAFDTDRRKLHLTQTFALSQIAAFELQQFRDTGVLTFATPQELFDREFPGHYLRLIKRVKVSLVALLPPVRGVRATLAASGVSRTVVGRGPFDTVTLRREPESIAFTSPSNATGLFELEPEGGLLLPFEGMGVDSIWQLELPKAANPFDFRSIADVLLTVEYTALDSALYREHVIRELDRRFSGDRTFSIRNQFPDAWYELNNPDTVEPEHRMRAVLPLTADDVPPHIADLHVEHASLFVVRTDELADELTITSVSHAAGGNTVTAGEVTTTGGIVSTRRPAGAAAWQALLNRHPAGRWEIRLADDELVRSWFRDGLIEDLVVVLTVGGTTPAWP